MKPVERVYIVVLVNDGMIMGGSMDTINELMFLRYPVQLHYERTYPLPGDPNEISINYNNILYHYTTNDPELVTLYNAAWEGGK